MFKPLYVKQSFNINLSTKSCLRIFKSSVTIIKRFRLNTEITIPMKSTDIVYNSYLKDDNSFSMFRNSISCNSFMPLLHGRFISEGDERTRLETTVKLNFLSLIFLPVFGLVGIGVTLAPLYGWLVSEEVPIILTFAGLAFVGLILLLLVGAQNEAIKAHKFFDSILQKMRNEENTSE